MDNININSIHNQSNIVNIQFTFNSHSIHIRSNKVNIQSNS